MKTRFSLFILVSLLALHCSSSVNADALDDNPAVLAVQAWQDEPVESYREGIQATFPQQDWQDVQSQLPYALMSYFAEMYKVSSDRSRRKNEALTERKNILTRLGYRELNQSEFPTSWQKYYVPGESSRYHNKNTELRIRTYLNPVKKTIVMAIAGTQFSKTASLHSAGTIAYGFQTQVLDEALSLSRDLKEKHPDYTLELTGASQGGAVAQYVSINMNDARAYVFNSQALHKTFTGDLNDNQLSRIHSAYIESEMLNNALVPGYWLIQNTMPVDGVVLKLDDELTERINGIYFTFSGIAYVFTPDNFILHWTGSVLEAVETLSGLNLKSLYY